MSVTPTDGELLRAADFDPHAFRVLYDRWAKPLLAFCYRRTCDPEMRPSMTVATTRRPVTRVAWAGTATPRPTAWGAMVISAPFLQLLSSTAAGCDPAGFKGRAGRPFGWGAVAAAAAGPRLRCWP